LHLKLLIAYREMEDFFISGTILREKSCKCQ